MLKINMPQEITADMKEAKKDYIDRHTPHVIAPAKVKKGEAFDVTVKLGNEYVHPDVIDHHIQWVQLYDGNTMLAMAMYQPGVTVAGKEEASGFTQVTFHVSLAKTGKLTAMSYCTKHGVWMSEEAVVEVE